MLAWTVLRFISEVLLVCPEAPVYLFTGMTVPL